MSLGALELSQYGAIAVHGNARNIARVLILSAMKALGHMPDELLYL